MKDTLNMGPAYRDKLMIGYFVLIFELPALRNWSNFSQFSPSQILGGKQLWESKCRRLDCEILRMNDAFG